MVVIIMLTPALIASIDAHMADGALKHPDVRNPMDMNRRLADLYSKVNNRANAPIGDQPNPELGKALLQLAGLCLRSFADLSLQDAGPTAATPPPP